jgi:hypothetical protein
MNWAEQTILIQISNSYQLKKLKHQHFELAKSAAWSDAA